MANPLRQLLLAAHVAARMVRSRRSKRLSTVTVISIVGVACGVVALTAVLGVTGGFQDAFRQRILGLYPHLVVLKRSSDFQEYQEVVARLREAPGVAGVTAATYDDMMIAAGSRRSGAIIKGIDLATVRDVLPLDDLMRAGDLDGLDEIPTVTRESGRVILSDVVAGRWLTVVAQADGVRVLDEDRTPPDSGRVRVTVLDLRGAPGPLALGLIPEGADARAPTPAAAPMPDAPDDVPPAPDADAPTPGADVKNSGPSAAGRRLSALFGKAGEADAGELADANGFADAPGIQRALDLREATPLGDSVPGALTAAVEVRAGLWRVDRTHELLELEPGTRVTLLLLPGDGPGAPTTRLLVDPARVPLGERAARVRLVNADPAAATLRLDPVPPDAVVGALTDGPEVAFGQATGFQTLAARLPGVVLGKDLAKRLSAGLGDEVTLVTPLRGVDNKMLGPYGMAPASSRHRVVGLFESGFYEYDVRIALVALPAAQRFLNRGDVVRWLEVRADDLMRVDAVGRRVAATLDPFDLQSLVTHTEALADKYRRVASGDVNSVNLGPPDSFLGQIDNQIRVLGVMKYQEVDFGYRPRYRIIDWQEMNTNLLGALKLQKVVLTIFFLIIVVVGSFVVVGSQIMVIHEKTPDIAILKAMGFTDGTVRLAFTLQGLMVAGVGTLAGLAVGLGLVGILEVIDFQLDASVYLIDHLPVKLSAWDLVVIALATASCTMIATQYSAGRAAAKRVVDGLRAVD